MADGTALAADNPSPSSSALPGQKLAKGNTIGPNGVILGPDGKPCKACNSLKAFGSIASTMKGGSGGNGGRRSTGSSPFGGFAAGGAAGAAASARAQDNGDEDGYKDCPADVETLGRHTWTFLHSTAAYYPSQPTPAEKQHASNLMNSLPSLYPCKTCASELEGEIKKVGPPKVDNGEALSKWLCDIHNEVNSRLGKKQFDCSLVLKRWKDGWDDGRCD